MTTIKLLHDFGSWIVPTSSLYHVFQYLRARQFSTLKPPLPVLFVFCDTLVSFLCNLHLSSIRGHPPFHPQYISIILLIFDVCFTVLVLLESCLGLDSDSPPTFGGYYCLEWRPPSCLGAYCLTTGWLPYYLLRLAQPRTHGHVFLVKENLPVCSGPLVKFSLVKSH